MERSEIYMKNKKT